jgi:deoxyadenosine/deoxycytidine kinase
MEKKSSDYIILAGNLGTGKTTLSNILSKQLANSVIFNEVRDIYLEQFYSNPQQFAFHNQLAYSLQYLEQAIAISNTSKTVIQDRSIYDTHYVFSDLWFKNGAISKNEFLLLERILHAAERIAKPTYLFLLDAEVNIAYERVLRRGLEIEKNVTKKYLSVLQEKYHKWYESFKVCPKAMILTDSIKPYEVSMVILEHIYKKNNNRLEGALCQKG